MRVFDGRGREWTRESSEMQAGTSRSGSARRRRAGAEPRVAITLAVAVLKGEKMDEVVRDAVMLGVTPIIPLFTDAHRSDRRARWRAAAESSDGGGLRLSSAKQCGRAVVPQIRRAACLRRGRASPAATYLRVDVRGTRLKRERSACSRPARG